MRCVCIAFTLSGVRSPPLPGREFPCSPKDFDATSLTRGFRFRQAFRVASGPGNATRRAGLHRFPRLGNIEETGDDVVVVKEDE